jgi:hypothetical protein
MAIRRRLAEGVAESELLDAVEGARSRSDDEGWYGVACPFAVVMAGAEYVRAYVLRGREARAAPERRRAAERELLAREREAERERRCMPLATRAALAKIIDAVSVGDYTKAARLAERAACDATSVGFTTRDSVSGQTGG